MQQPYQPHGGTAEVRICTLHWSLRDQPRRLKGARPGGSWGSGGSPQLWLAFLVSKWLENQPAGKAQKALWGFSLVTRQRRSPLFSPAHQWLKDYQVWAPEVIWGPSLLPHSLASTGAQQARRATPRTMERALGEEQRAPGATSSKTWRRSPSK